MFILAQIESTILEWLQASITENGLSLTLLVLLFVFVMFAWKRDSDNRKESDKRYEDLVKKQSERLDNVEDKLDKTEQERDKEREQFEADRRRYQEDADAARRERDQISERLKTEIEILQKEREQDKERIMELSNELQEVNKRLAEFEREKLIDREEKEQMIRENQRLTSELASTKRSFERLEKQLNVANQMLADYKIRVDNLEEKYNKKDMDLREAYGRIVDLTTKLQENKIDDTQKIPDAALEQLNIKDVEDTAKITPIDDDEDKKDIA